MTSSVLGGFSSPVGKVHTCDRCKKAFVVKNGLIGTLKPRTIKTDFMPFDLIGHRDWTGPGLELCPDCMDSLRAWFSEYGSKSYIGLHNLGK